MTTCLLFSTSWWALPLLGKAKTVTETCPEQQWIQKHQKGWGQQGVAGVVRTPGNGAFDRAGIQDVTIGTDHSKKATVWKFLQQKPWAKCWFSLIRASSPPLSLREAGQRVGGQASPLSWPPGAVWGGLGLPADVWGHRVVNVSHLFKHVHHFYCLLHKMLVG